MTKPLAQACFDRAEAEEYYASAVADCRVAAAIEDGAIRSMVHLRRFIARCGEEERLVWYLQYVGTDPAYRRRGYMASVMRFVLDSLRREGEQFAFLVPVDKEVYRSLGFVHFWQFREEERTSLLADDGLTDCAACVLSGGAFTAPTQLRPADTLRDIRYAPFTADAAARHFSIFYARHNATCDSLPLETVAYAQSMQMQFCLLDGRCLLLRGADGTGAIPYCSEADLPYYFSLQQRYFNEVLHLPFCTKWGDEAGTELLRRAGLLENYEVTERAEIYDYIYAGDDMRQLAGRKFAKKRNHISKFERKYEGRWEYRTLGYADREEILAFVGRWAQTREASAQSEAGDVDADFTAAADLAGTRAVVGNAKLMQKVRAGGIYIDGELRAFSMGGYNPTEDMAVVGVEKADPSVDGLYQLINREFVRHEFPAAAWINREDDVGLPGLRKAKLSYYPARFAKRISLRQKEFTA